jgi:mono/diheme cytochrome c family protein
MSNQVSRPSSGRRRTVRLLSSAALSFWLMTAPGAADPGPPVIEFNRDIRPLLSDNCFQCHGPDKARRKANLRLDIESGGAFEKRTGSRVITPGNPHESELLRRISAADQHERMPPVKTGRKLTAAQIELVRRWIEQGAKWQEHWSLLPPVRRPPPWVKNAGWPRNPIDAFVLSRLERAGLAPAPEADKTTLIRRVTLDLAGLPPTIGEVDAFLADPADDAYEKVVDRLLQSHRYGERMATRWLDAARYADTNGYQNDGERFMWRWRDWVIDAYNRNLPFDQFTIEQLAGDLLPNPTLEQRIATGFNRNHRGNAEGGIIPEEYAVEYVVDRVETTATVWLGLTMGCARCHDHKYDPIRQREFYQVFAFFNNVPENGRAIKFGNSPPMIKAPTREQQTQLAKLEQRLAQAERRFAQLQPELAATQAAWERTLYCGEDIPWSLSKGLLTHFPLDGNTADQCRHAGCARIRDGRPAYAPGRLGLAAALDGRCYLDAGDVGNFGFYDKFSCGAWVFPQGPQGGGILSRMTDTATSDGYNLQLQDGKVHVHLVKRWLDDAARVETVASLTANQWHHVFMTYDGSRTAHGIKIYVDGRAQRLKVNLDELNQSFNTAEPFRIGAKGTGSRFVGLIDDVRVYREALSPEDVSLIATTEPIQQIAAMPAGQRTQAQAYKVRSYFLERPAPPSIQQAFGELQSLREQRDRLVENFPTTMVMEERPTPRETHVLVRGQYDKKGERVTPGVPARLPPLPPAGKLDRLAFARWLVGRDHPLTARVAVNRFWQMYFGVGLVKTTEDFGSQGEWPVHPELLDWLATEFVRTGWDMKRLQRTIVTSATYRQSSHLTPELLRQDPDNRLLARGPRLRMPAEMIRDQVLSVSGLLSERVGGPSVRPYQPAGLWKELTGSEDYTQQHGDNLYRRSIYTFWKRTVAPPTMMAFDAAGREACVVRETRTNTPLQALALMNEVTFVEAARVLAQRVMKEGGKMPQGRITYAFRLATARQPSPEELDILLKGFQGQLKHFSMHPKAAAELVQAGEYPRDQSLNISELAAYMSAMNLILNLDETVTKE